MYIKMIWMSIHFMFFSPTNQVFMILSVLIVYLKVKIAKDTFENSLVEYYLYIYNRILIHVVFICFIF